VTGGARSSPRPTFARIVRRARNGTADQSECREACNAAANDSALERARHGYLHQTRSDGRFRATRNAPRSAVSRALCRRTWSIARSSSIPPCERRPRTVTRSTTCVPTWRAWRLRTGGLLRARRWSGSPSASRARRSSGRSYRSPCASYREGSRRCGGGLDRLGPDLGSDGRGPPRRRSAQA
jgi:hypothetical protein